jgi:hypothetical protein
MKTNRRFLYIVMLPALAAFAFGSSPVTAQGDEEEDDRFGYVFAEAEAWIAQASGLDYFPATLHNPEDPFDVELLSPPYSTETRGRYRFGYELGKNRGGLAITYYSHEEKLQMTGVSPGDFIYGANLAHPLYAGFYNDGLVDGYNAETVTGLRDYRIEYFRTAFNTPRANGRWSIGLRRVIHTREIDSQYYALVPPLPALIPPFYTPPQQQEIGLDPQPDLAYMSSEFNGRGVSAGLDVALPLWKDKVLLEGGLALAVLRGKTDTEYRSTTWYYLFRSQEGDYIMEPPFSEFVDVDTDGAPLVSGIEQLREDYGLHADRLSSTALVMETYLGVRWNIWRGIQWFGGFRSARYTDVAVDMRAGAAPNASGTSLVVEETDRSVTYEGLYTGLAYRF